MKSGHIKGMLLEEAILYFLRRCGYRIVNAQGNDPTLDYHSAGIAVRGRGSKHQIDAIADFLVNQPFSNPQRLLVEAKCHSRRVGVDVVRNAIGVLKDVSEFWTPGAQGRISGYSRYHYQYAVFSATPFSSDAQDYAFAQDVYLFPLNRSTFFLPVLYKIDLVGQGWETRTQATRNLPIDHHPLAALRAFVRKWLRDGRQPQNVPLSVQNGHIDVSAFIEACLRIQYVLIAVLGGRFPVLLVPSPELLDRHLEDITYVRIYWNNEGWWLENQDGEPLFSFDLPDDLFSLYANEGLLGLGRALDMKQDFMSTIQATELVGERSRILTLKLDGEWLEDVRKGLNPNEN